jgi:hypothetical protein
VIGRRVTVAAGLLVTAAMGGAAQTPATQPGYDTRVLTAMTAWVQAVDAHVPGAVDRAVTYVWTLSAADINAITDNAGLFVTALIKPGTLTPESPQDAAIVKLAATMAATVSGTDFLRRAAILHTDAVVLDHGQHPPKSAGRFETNAGLVETLDGEYVGASHGNYNWPFVRSLLDHVVKPASDPFVPLWYHAAAAYMFSTGNLGEVGPHLDRAAHVLPEDKWILFDRGCRAEMLGLERSQELRPDPKVSQPQPLIKRTGFPFDAKIPDAKTTDRDAENLFRHALDVDATVVEARVRLARLLEIRGVYPEADADLAQAIATNPPPVLSYFAELLASRAARALGQLDAAVGHADAALKLFPDAQSGLIAKSQIGVLRADLDGALAAVRHLSAPITGPREEADPWWLYQFGSGRESAMLLANLRALVPAPVPGRY